MKFSRITAAATLSSALVLAACSGDDTAGEPTESADQGATAAPTDDATTATDDAAESTTVEMTTEAQAGAVSLEDAEEAATEVLTQRVRADQGDGEDVEEAQEASMAGTALRAHRAADRLEGVEGEPAEVDLEENPVEPTVLAISRDDEETPAYLLVQTVPEEGAPRLHLMTSDSGETEDFRITWEASMLPGTQVPTFDGRASGSPVLREGQGELTMPPRDLLKSVGAYTEWPQPEETPDYRTHGYAPAVRDAAQTQAAELDGQAELREKNWLVSDDVTTLLFEDGTGFVMGSLLRDTQFVVNPGTELTTSDAFRAFQDTEVLTSQATLRTSVFIAMRAPSEDVEFKPEMIAATEQLVDASGE
ncbi:hypothetical protein [Serinicoccus marinus]|uniref:hypothetical protein n=1 Tax=Serinicoccus marinus TaxID=247333 RepID=UPI0003B58840|nr:hypothetical protein [Serinicoccus marinus]